MTGLHLKSCVVRSWTLEDVGSVQRDANNRNVWLNLRDLLPHPYAEPIASNRASARVLEKAGFICEGRLRSNILKDGKVLDSFLYACVREPRGSGREVRTA